MEITVNISPQAQQLIRVLEDAGFEAWVVGGRVRDAVCKTLGKGTGAAGASAEPAESAAAAADIDIACSATPRQTERVCEQAGFRVRETGLQHGTVTVIVDGQAFEVTTFRIDGSYSDSRHPDTVRFTASIELDLARRDFTMNAIAWHPERGILDPYGGIVDIRQERIRSVGDPGKRFAEDALRILRGVRFASQLGFKIEGETWEAMVHGKWRLTKISEERIRREFDKLLLGDHVQDALMRYAPVILIVVPELAALKDFDQHSVYHCFDVYDHTAWVVHYMSKDVIGRWAALCHDLGKPAAFVMHDGHGHFPQHATIGERLTRGATAQHLMSQADTARIATLVRYHDLHGQTDRKSVRRMLARLDGDVGLYRSLLALQRADALAHAPKHTERAREADECERILQQLLNEPDGSGAFCLRNLAVNGDDLVAQGIEPGPELGKLLQQLLDDVIEERIPNEREALLGRYAELHGDN